MKPAFKSDIQICKRSRAPGILIGVRNICAYVQIGPQTFYKLHTSHDLPATRLPDGRWCTSRTLIDQWIVNRWKAQKIQEKAAMSTTQSAGGAGMEAVA